MATRMRDLILAARDICLEYDSTPFDDDYIVRKLQFAVNYIYNHFVKSNESMYHRRFPIEIKTRVVEYDLPKQLFGRRVERMEVPSPPTSGSAPYCWVEVDKKDPKSVVKHDAPRTPTLMPSAWGQQDNKIILAPPPMVPYTARLICAMALPPIRRDEGLITSFSGNKIRLDDAPSPNMHNALATEGANLLSICCGQTGRIKKVYPFEEISGREITLSSTTRQTIQSYPVTSLVEVNGYSVTYNPATNTALINSVDPLPSSLTVGDFIEIVYGLQAGEGYNIEDVLTDDSDFYNPPEFVAGTNPFSRAVQIVGIVGNSIEVDATGFTPALEGGYPVPYTNLSGNVINAVLGTYSGNPVIEIELDSPHGFENAKVYKIQINGTGIAEIDGLTTKCYRVTDTKLAVLAPTLTGVFAPGTWNLYQYSVTPDTGIPPLSGISVTNPSQLIVSIFKNSPYSYQIYPEKQPNRWDMYDPIDNIEEDDIVSVGYSIGAFPLPQAYEEIVTLYAALPMRSSMNESDSVGVALLKELMASMKGDTAGRTVGTVISRDFSRRGFFTRATYRSRR